MITLAHLHASMERALTHAENPAIARLTDRTVEGVARAYFPRTAHTNNGAIGVGYALGKLDVYAREVLDLTDPGTTHALLVALSLALGLDPGVGGLGVAWCTVEHGHQLSASRACVRLLLAERPHGWYGRTIFSPTVAAEPDPIKALGLAVLHVLGVKP